jgi:hypothetical protein
MIILGVHFPDRVWEPSNKGWVSRKVKHKDIVDRVKRVLYTNDGKRRKGKVSDDVRSQVFVIIGKINRGEI